MSRSRGITALLLATTLVLVAGTCLARGAKDVPVIYVISQRLYFDSIVINTELPRKGPFEDLFECEVNGYFGLCTEYGPGSRGHQGGKNRSVAFVEQKSRAHVGAAFLYT